jgi:hypothetical protein
VSDQLHIQDEQHPKLTLCGRWRLHSDLLGDDLDTDERTVCLPCARRLLALRVHARLTRPEQEPQGAPAIDPRPTSEAGEPGWHAKPQGAPDPTDHEAVLYEADPAGYREGAPRCDNPECDDNCKELHPGL